MKIEKKTKEMIKFEDVEVGECFMTEEAVEEIYIKMFKEVLSPNGSGRRNAMGLSDGDTYKFELDEEVIPVNAKVVIE